MKHFRYTELELLDQQPTGTHKFRTNKVSDQLIFGLFAILTDLFWPGVLCFTVGL